MSSLLKGKLEGKVDIDEASGDVFHDIFAFRPHLIPSTIYDGFIQSCELIQGAYGISGSTIKWTYIIDGKIKTLKLIFDIIEGRNKAMDFICIDGDLMKDYTSFIISYKLFPLAEGNISRKVIWTFEYVKKQPYFPEPTQEMDAFIDITKKIDEHHRATLNYVE